MPALDAERDRVLTLLRRFGWNALSFQVLAPHFLYWFHGDAVVAYVDTGGAWVAAGPPISAETELREVAEGFIADAHAHHRRASFFGVEERFLHAFQSTRQLLLGEQPVWDPREWSASLTSRSSLREQVRRARAKGVTVQLVDPVELVGTELSTQVDRLAHRWLAGKPMAALGFLVSLQPLAFVGERQAWRAEREGKLVGWMTATPLYARQGWLLEHLLRDPTAPNGTIELLVNTAMESAAEQGLTYVTLGLVPLSGDISRGLRVIRKVASILYSFDGLRRFKSKLKPRAWDPIWLSIPPRQSVLASVWDVLVAFAGNRPLRFAWDTVRRGPSWALRLLAAALIPWTLMLVIAPSQQWFPSALVKWSWVGFDALLAVALFSLASRWRRGLAKLLAVLVTTDAGLTTTQAILYNRLLVHDLRHDAASIAMVCVAMIAPALAAVLLWNWLRAVLDDEFPT